MEQKELLTVIVADDETELREAVCSVIPWKEIGFRLVGSAGNGLDALQLVEQLQPDLLLTDIRMPYISGVSLAQQVRELRPLTQIAFLSGYDDFAYAQKAIEYNVISYLLKPISMRELTEALAEIRGKIRRKFARLLPQKPEKSGWRELLLPLLLDGFAEEAQQDDPALLASLVGAGILAAGQERYSLTVLAIRLEQDGKNRTTPDMAYTVDMLLGKLCRSRSVYSGGRLLTLLIAEEEPRGLELAIDELRQSFARVLELRAIVGISHPFTSFCRCHAASREAVDAQRFAGESGIYHISQIAAESGTAQTDLGALLAPLDNLLRSGSREELEKQLVQAQEEYEEATKTAKRSNYICNELFTWADVYDTANHDECRAILQQFITEIRVRKDYEISITLNASFNQVEQLKAVSTYDGAEIFEEISEKGA